MKLNVSVFELLFKDDSYNMSQGIQQNSSRNSMQMLYRLKRMSFSRLSLLFRVPFEWEHSMGKDMIRLNRRILRLRCLDEFWAFLVDNKRKGTLAKNKLIFVRFGSARCRVCRVWDICQNLQDRQWPSQQGIQDTTLYHYRLCDRQHSLQLSMGSKTPYSMRHSLRNNQKDHVEILHCLLNYYFITGRIHYLNWS